MKFKSLICIVVFSVLLFGFATAGFSQEKPVPPPSPKLTLESTDGQNYITFGLAVQMIFEYLEKDQGDDAHPEYSGNFKWRRIRPTVRGGLLNGQLEYYLHLSTTPGALELMDFYVDYNMAPMLRLRFGQSKIPFTRYRIQSFKNLQFTDWSIVTKYFGAERQIGLAFHNGYEKPEPVEYMLGFYNGMNSRKSHAVGLAEVTGEPVGNPSDLIDPAPLNEVHPAIAFRLAYNYRNIATAYETDFDKGPFRFAVGQSSVWDANPVPYRDFALRFSPEALFKAYGMSLSGTYYFGWYEPHGEIDEMTFGMTGGVFQGGYLIGRAVEITYRYSFVGTTEDLRDDARAHAASQIAQAPTGEELEELEATYADAGDLRTKREQTLGLNLYLIDRTLKLQNDASIIQTEDFTGEMLEDFRFRTQLQLAF